MAKTDRAPLSLGDAFRDAGRVLAQHGLVLFPLALVLAYPAAAGAAWLRGHPIIPGAGVPISLANGCLSWVISATPTALWAAIATWIAAQALEGRKPALGDALREGLKLFVPVLIVQILYILGMMAGMVLLIVPGLIVALMWLLVAQVLVVERVSITQAFQRSRALTKGHRWALLGLLVVYFLIVVAVEWVVFKTAAPGKTFVQAAAAPINAYGFVPLLGAVLTPFTTVVATAIYMRLRGGHGSSADAAAEVFA